MNCKQKTYVIGHKNPDTDSICSAISYAFLKNQIEKNDRYIPLRCGHVNQETAYVLDYFGVKAPEYITDVSPQVQDAEIRRLHGISEDISLNTAFRLMKEQECVTLPVVDHEQHLRGVITINDIAESNMDMYDNRIVGNARTPIKNILSTIDGKVLCGNSHAFITKGKVIIAASSEEVMNDFLLEDDLVITADRTRAQICAIKNKASCLIVCGPNKIRKSTLELAEKNEVIVIETAHDTYTTARLINHSMPVRRFMSSKDLVTFKLTDSIESVHEVMAKLRIRDFPVLNENDEYVGMISRRNLLGLHKKEIIMVDHNELSQAVDGIDDAEILEIIDHHRLGTIETTSPVYFRCQPLGCTSTIVYQLFKENGIEPVKSIAGLLCSAILSDTLMFRSPTCTAYDEKAARELADIAGIEVESFAKAMFNAGSDLKNKSAEDIFFQDFKKFNVGDISFGAGQITSMNEEDFPDIIAKLKPFMDKERAELRVDGLYFLITGILSESSYIICCGDGACELAEEAFHVKANDGVLHAEGVVSRKKQFIPPMVRLLQQK
ncbi:MAG: putative manganese-dependent inorganic diphosphatase [Eubacteriales bacterium]|nr:putative manganese-dependent inorganic diphosphatase [Eubacteriales bacterium]